MTTIWTPGLIDTELWLDAADSDTITITSGAVSQWSDKSGKSRHAIQTTSSYRPVIDGDGYLSFDGNDDFLEMDTPVYGSFSVFFVLRTSDTRGSWDWYSSPPVLGGEYAGGVADWGLVLSYGKLSCVCNEHGGQRYGIGAWNSGASFVYGVTRESGTGVLSFWGNGSSDGTNTTSGANITAAPKTRICGHPANSAQLSAKIAEIIVTNSVATTEYRQKIEGYLAYKWGLTSSLPSDHPYKISAPSAFSVSGTITGADGNPAARVAKVYRLNDNRLLGEVVSDAVTGDYVILTDSNDEVYRIVLADETELYNDIVDRVIPG